MISESHSAPATREARVIEDCQRMLRFALKQNLMLSPPLRRDIARADGILKRLKLPILSGLPLGLVNEVPEDESGHEAAASAAADPHFRTGRSAIAASGAGAIEPLVVPAASLRAREGVFRKTPAVHNGR